jgi:hypothetical protein
MLMIQSLYKFQTFNFFFLFKCPITNSEINKKKYEKSKADLLLNTTGQKESEIAELEVFRIRF